MMKLLASWLKFEAQSHCLTWEQGESVIFTEGSFYGTGQLQGFIILIGKSLVLFGVSKLNKTLLSHLIARL
jgi:hypothetical protein